MIRPTLLLASTVVAAAPIPAQAQPAPSAPTPPASAQPGEADHHEHGQDIVVTGRYVRNLDLLAGTSVMSGVELQREIRPQLGDTLTKLPGVSATSFSPGASRPVLRGFQGERIRVLTEGIGSIDVSNTSADHAVTIDPLTAERIEVLRGPAVLLFGGQAIGGAVNVHDRRIPRSLPEGGEHFDIIGALGSAADERSLGAAADVALGKSGVVLHANGSWRKTGDLRTGGFVLSDDLRAEQRAIAAEELAEGHADEAAEALELADSRGAIPNSATEQKTASLGGALIRDSFDVGVAYSLFDTAYGVPMRPGDGHADEDGGEEGHGVEPVSIGLRQHRVDLRGEYRPDAGPFERLRLRIGAATYKHTEFEGEEVGTVFRSKGIEGRLELAQRDRGGWSGTSGAQLFRRKFDAVGAEAFLPANETGQIGLFTLQEVTLGKASIEGSARLEHSDVRSDPLDLRRRFDAFSLAGGGSYEFAPQAKVGINLSRTERAPSAEELFSNGPHVATQAFEVGNPDLDKERSLGAEAYVRLDRRDIALGLTAFANRFDDFIYQAATGEEQDELPVFQYFQRDASWYGFEAEASATVWPKGDFRFVADGVADYVRATVKGAGPVPRIPPLRLLGGLEAQSDLWDARAEVEWVADQERIAANETPTDGYTMVNASLAWRPWGKARESVVTLSASNIFDVEARRHASFTKDFVPMAGRDIRLGARFSF